MPLLSLQTLHKLVPLAGVGIKSEMLRHGFITTLLLIIPFLFPGWTAKRRLVHEGFEKNQIPRELLYFASSVCVFGVVIGLMFLARYRGLTRIYLSINDHGWIYFFFSIVLMILIQDTLTYWTHRFLHTRFLFERIHSVHHLFRRISPITAISYHPLEAFLHGLTFPMIVFLFPVHPAALFIFAVLQTVANSYGHSGYEGYPKWFARFGWNRILTTSTFHGLHHVQLDGNYGFYFTFWDRICGTISKNYQSIYCGLAGVDERASTRLEPDRSSKIFP